MQSKIGMKIRKRCHISSGRAANEVLPYLRVIAENNSEMAKGIAEWLDLDDDMVEYLMPKGAE